MKTTLLANNAKKMPALKEPRQFWTKEEESILRQFYAVAGASAPINLGKIAAIIGRDKSNVCRKAKQMGLETNLARRKTPAKLDNRALPLDWLTPWKKDNPHPRGFAGRTHTPEARAVMSSASDRNGGYERTQEHRDILAVAMHERNQAGGNVYSRTKKGWFEVGGQRIFCKSSWEMNYAAYLQWLVDNKQILSWLYEPDIFWFEDIRRGVRSYTPDFKITNNDGSVEYHEVKGWFDDKSKTKMKRMAKYHPTTKLLLIDESVYRTLKRQLPRVFCY